MCGLLHVTWNADDVSFWKQSTFCLRSGIGGKPSLLGTQVYTVLETFGGFLRKFVAYIILRQKSLFAPNRPGSFEFMAKCSVRLPKITPWVILSVLLGEGQ